MIPNRVKFFAAGPWLEWADSRIKGDPYGTVSCLATGEDLRILDLCTGTGYGARTLKAAHSSANVSGIDSSPELIAFGRLRCGPGIELHLGDVRELPWPGGTFDLITCFFGLHELSQGVRRQCIAEAVRVMKDDASLLMCEPTMPHRWGRMFRMYLYASHGPSAAELLDGGLERELQAGGLSVELASHHASGLLPYKIVRGLKDRTTPS